LSNNHAHIAGGYSANGNHLSLPKARPISATKRFGVSSGNGEYTSTTLEQHVAAMDSAEFDRY
jgi:hypothetical protein